ncbi:MAG: class I SAM-dependent methyltransferase [Pedobacter sp.]|nr:MAG: class I SAM-dependent methyltransferase [Pedobacter sp.]
MVQKYHIIIIITKTMVIYYRIKDKIFNLFKSKVLRNMYMGTRLSKPVWENQFDSGYWDYLYSDDEKEHYSCICDFYSKFALGKSVLDVGCGQGVLYHYLTENIDKTIEYFGIDISSNAVELAKKQFPDCHFMQLDFDRDGLEQKFDVIIFNETLYYFDQPLKTIQESANSNLNRGGHFIVSMFDIPANDKIWQVLHEEYLFIEVKNISNLKGQKWRVGMFKP